jgi:uncharacterized protein (DUF433 family)
MRPNKKGDVAGWFGEPSRRHSGLHLGLEVLPPSRQSEYWVNAIETPPKKSFSSFALDWYVQCTVEGLEALRECVEVDPDVKSGVPVVKGTRFTIAQIFAELAETDAPREVSVNFDLEEELIKKVLSGFSMMMNKPFAG